VHDLRSLIDEPPKACPEPVRSTQPEPPPSALPIAVNSACQRETEPTSRSMGSVEIALQRPANLGLGCTAISKAYSRTVDRVHALNASMSPTRTTAVASPPEGADLASKRMK